MSLSLNRRGFLGLSSLAAAAAALPPPPARAGTPVTRVLGRTGLKVSEVGMGVMITSDPTVVAAALDAGITYFDTARSYGGGNNEVVLREGLGARRTQVVVATKAVPYGRDSIVASCEASLQALGTDYIDVFQLHGIGDAAAARDEGSLAALAALKKAGKIRFAGLTTHGNMVAVMQAAVEAKVYDVVLTSYNFQTGPEVEAQVKATAAAGLGVVAMKIMVGGYTMTAAPGLNPYQSALRHVLLNKGLATTIPSMTTLEQVRENAAVMGTAVTLRDRLALELYAAATAGRYCTACGGCAGTCARGVDIPAAMRGLMYAEGYRRPELALPTVAAALAPCAGCGECTARCRRDLDAPARLAAARSLRAAGAPVA